MPRQKKPKKVAYRLISATSDEGRPMYALLQELVDAHHEDLHDAKIALAWCTSWKPDADGVKTLGKCKKASDLDRELSEWDFIILLDQTFWQDSMVKPIQQRALLDHELTHAEITYDANGEPQIDERGRTVFRMRKHDIEEFVSIVERYGCYKSDLETFSKALARARQQASDQWVGYQSLQEDLAAAGLAIPLDVIVGWSDAERREARTWALLRQDSLPQIWREAMPAFLVRPAADGATDTPTA